MDGSASGSGSGSATSDLEAMMKELGLREEDLVDVVVEEDDLLPEEATRWMAIVFKNLRADWFRGPKRGPGADRNTVGNRGRGRAGRSGCGAPHNTIELAKFVEDEDPDATTIEAGRNRKHTSEVDLAAGAPTASAHASEMGALLTLPPP